MLAEKGLKPWEQARLTLRQKFEIYFHPRDKDGAIVIPDPERVLPAADQPLTLEEELRQLDLLALIIENETKQPFPPEKLAQLKEELRQKFAQPEKPCPSP